MEGENQERKVGLRYLPYLTIYLIKSPSRIQTPGPVTGSFKDQFNKVGVEVWEEWDKYLTSTWNGKQSS